MTESEILNVLIATTKEYHLRNSVNRPQYLKDNPNNFWKLPMNLVTLKDMGRMDLYDREGKRQKAIKEADKKWMQEHGRYITEEEFRNLTK